MKLNTEKLVKRTVFIYKSKASKDSLTTDPTEKTQTVVTTGTGTWLSGKLY